MTTIVEDVQASADLFLSAIGSNAEVVPSIEQLRRHLEESARRVRHRARLGRRHPCRDELRRHPTGASANDQCDPSAKARGQQCACRRHASGMRDVVEERDLTGLSTAVRRAHSLHEALLAGEAGENQQVRGPTVTVFSAKGGVGKTTVSTNVAVALAQMDYKVCLVDLDLAFGDVAITLQLLPEHTIADAVSMQADLDGESLDALLTKYSDNLFALVAPTSPLAKATISQESSARSSPA